MAIPPDRNDFAQTPRTRVVCDRRDVALDAARRSRTRENERTRSASHRRAPPPEGRHVMAERVPDQTRHQVVVVGSGFGGLFGTKALRRADVDVTMIAQDDPPPLPAAALPGGHGHPVRGRDRAARRGRCCPARRTPGCCSATVTDIDLTRRDGHLPRARSRDDDVVRLADRGRGRGQSYFGNDHFAEFAPGMKTHRRRARAARPHLRRLRDGRARRQPRGERRRAS